MEITAEVIVQHHITLQLYTAIFCLARLYTIKVSDH